MPLYGFVVKGRFVVVGPPSPGRAAPRIIYDRGSVIVDSTGDPIEVAEWSSKSPNAAAEDSAFRGHFASLS